MPFTQIQLLTRVMPVSIFMRFMQIQLLTRVMPVKAISCVLCRFNFWLDSCLSKQFHAFHADSTFEKSHACQSIFMRFMQIQLLTRIMPVKAASCVLCRFNFWQESCLSKQFHAFYADSTFDKSHAWLIKFHAFHADSCLYISFNPLKQIYAFTQIQAFKFDSRLKIRFIIKLVWNFWSADSYLEADSQAQKIFFWSRFIYSIVNSK